MTDTAQSGAPDSDAALSRLAKKVQASRTVFEAAFDDLAIAHAPGSHVFKALARMRERHGPKPERNQRRSPQRLRDEADFLVALKHARDQGWLPLLILQSAELLFGGPKGGLSGSLQDTTSGELQAIVNLHQKFQMALALQNGYIAALRRCCRIEIERENDVSAQGSGFLIGPHLVLTNWHVIRHALDASDKPIEGIHTRMKVEFDVLVTDQNRLLQTEIVRPAENWLVASSKATENEQNSGDDNRPFWPDEVDQLRNNLDFAILELSRPVGHQRGWYDIRESAWPEDEAASIDLLQFPRRMSMHGTTGTLETNDRTERFGDGIPPRFLHSANAYGGSSGGPILGHDRNVIGLHQAGLRFREIDPMEGEQQYVSLNAGIPVRLIADVAAADIAARMANVPTPVYLSRDGTPIIGRTGFMSMVAAAERSRSGLMVIETPLQHGTANSPQRIGKTYSKDILQAILPANEHNVIYLSAEEIQQNAFKTAKAILAADSPRVASFLSDSLNTTMNADAVGMLVEGTVQALRDGARGRSMWLVIDDIDRYPIGSNWPSSTFLQALYQRTKTNRELRIILIGLPARLEMFAELEPIGSEILQSHLTDTEIRGWLEAFCRDSGPLPAGFADRLLKIVLSISGEESDDPDVGRTEAIANALSTHIVDAFQSGRFSNG